MTSTMITMTTITNSPTTVCHGARFVRVPLVAERPPGEPVEDRPRPIVAAGLAPMPGLALLRPWSRS
jgi:hypothetical protein